MSPADCDAVILAGGKATRLQSVVADRPKVLAQIAGRPFAHYLLTQLARAGFRRVVFCTGHLADQVEAALGTDWDGMELVYSREETALDTAGAVRLALPQLKAPVSVVINGDTFLGLDFAAMLAAMDARKTAAAMALVEVPDVSRFGSVVLSQDLVTGFVEKGAGGDKPALINGGIYALSRPMIEAIPGSQKLSIEKDIMPGWMSQGVLGFQAAGPFIDIGTPDSFAQAQDVLIRWAAE